VPANRRQGATRAPSSTRRSWVLVVSMGTQKLRMDVDALWYHAGVGPEGHFFESSFLTMP
jgi:hypothetical protein